MKIIRIISSFILITTLANSSSLFAQQEVDSFLMPTPLDLVTPTYPRQALSSNEEGVIEFNFMVDVDGKPFNPIVTYSIGADSFQRAALRALNDSEFNPATANGEAIVGSSTFRYKFSIDSGDGPSEIRASNPFARRYRNFGRALETGDQATIESRLEELEERSSNNFYEDAFLNYARFNAAQRFGSEIEQMEYLHGALSYSNAPDDFIYLNNDTAIELRRNLLYLQIITQHYAEALDTYALIEHYDDTEGISMYEGAIEDVRGLEFDEYAYSVEIALNSSGTKWFNLFKHHMYFTGGQGSLDEVRLWCSRKYVAFIPERDFNYDIPAEWGQCLMQIIGDPHATASLVQN